MDKLHELTHDGGFQSKVRATLIRMAQLGLKPKIYEAKRTVEEQKEKVRKGYSKTMRSFHLKRGKDGGAMAADIADADKGWNAEKRFWLVLGANAESRGLGWGGLFGLNGKQKQALLEAFDVLRIEGWPDNHPAYAVKIGWDPAHLENRDLW